MIITLPRRSVNADGVGTLLDLARARELESARLISQDDRAIEDAYAFIRRMIPGVRNSHLAYERWSRESTYIQHVHLVALTLPRTTHVAATL